MSDMADLLAEHWSASTHTDQEPPVDKCDGCGAVLRKWGDDSDMPAQLAAHQAAALSAAGFGPVPEARTRALLDAAEALDLQPPKLKAQYVSTLRLYALEPWRLETKRRASDDGS